VWLKSCESFPEGWGLSHSAKIVAHVRLASVRSKTIRVVEVEVMTDAVAAKAHIKSSEGCKLQGDLDGINGENHRRQINWLEVMMLGDYPKDKTITFSWKEKGPVETDTISVNDRPIYTSSWDTKHPSTKPVSQECHDIHTPKAE
jgi:hypothetical protein